MKLGDRSPWQALPLVFLLLVGIALLYATCTHYKSKEVEDEPATVSGTRDVSTATVFDLAPADYAALERRATSGDGEASFRLSQFYSMAGGSDGRSDDDLVGGDDAVQELRWLELGASQGHETAKFNLAVMLARSGRDCARGLALMTAISKESPSSDTRKGAGYWLRDASFECDASGAIASIAQ